MKKHFSANQRIVLHSLYVGRVQTCLRAQCCVLDYYFMDRGVCFVTSALLTENGSWQHGHQRRKVGHVDIVFYCWLVHPRGFTKQAFISCFPPKVPYAHESSTVVNHCVCVKPLSDKLSTTYHVSISLAFGYVVSIKLMVLLHSIL